MPIRSYQLTGYRIRIGAPAEACIGDALVRPSASVCASAGNDAELTLHFLPDNAPMPTPPGYSKDGGRLGAICLPERLLAPTLELLRDEKPVWICIDPDEPARNEIRAARGHATADPGPDEGVRAER